MSVEVMSGGGGSPKLQTKIATPNTSKQIVVPDTGYDGLSQVTVNAISPTLAATTYTPSTIDQKILSGRWLTGTQVIKGDKNLISGNIKSGISIFGVNGTLEEGLPVNFGEFTSPTGGARAITVNTDKYFSTIDYIYCIFTYTGSALETNFNMNCISFVYNAEESKVYTIYSNGGYANLSSSVFILNNTKNSDGSGTVIFGFQNSSSIGFASGGPYSYAIIGKK